MPLLRDALCRTPRRHLDRTGSSALGTVDVDVIRLVRRPETVNGRRRIWVRREKIIRPIVKVGFLGSGRYQSADPAKSGSYS